MYQNISLISVPVASQEIALAFYTKKLGCKIVRDMPFGPETRWLQLQFPGVSTNIVLVTWFDAMRPGGLQGVVITTDDIQKMHAGLKKRGVNISDIDKQDYGQEATFYDPDGNGWVLQQPA